MKKLPKYFLGNSIEEAKNIHSRYIKLLNEVAREYSLSTGLDKKDLISESLFALANAVATYDKSKGKTLKQFIFLKVKDQLNNYIRKNNSAVNVPKYIERTIKLINKIEKLLVKYDYSNNIDYILINQSIDTNTIEDVNDQETLKQQFTYLNNYAKRAHITTEKLVKRARFVPKDIYSLFEINNLIDNNQDTEQIYTKIVVHDLLKKMNKEEKTISMGIMQGKTHKEISKEMEIPETRIKKILAKLQIRFKDFLKEVKTIDRNTSH